MPTPALTATPTPRPARTGVRARRAAALIAAATVTVLLAAGCDDSTTTDAKPAAATASATPTTATPTPSPTPTPTARKPYTVGTAWEWQMTGTGTSVAGSTVVVAYDQDVAKNAPSPEEANGPESHGYVWSALNVKVCSQSYSSETVPVSSSEWKLTYDDGTMVSPSSTGYEQFPKPEFPFGGADLVAGRCVAGKIVFAVPGGRKPARAMYAPAALDEPVEWNIPQ